MLEAFGRRLREERLESRANQSEFAAWGGARKNSQISYEAGKTSPPVEYLLRLDQHGVDIGYVLTGQRNDGSLNLPTQLLAQLFEKLSARERQAVFELISTLAGASIAPVDLDEQARAARQQLATMTQSQRLNEPRDPLMGLRG